jgi:replication factor C subunit 3/5
LKRESGIALQDIISEIYNYARTISYPAKSRILILKNLSDIEYRLGEGANEQIQLGALIGTFKLAQENLS